MRMDLLSDLASLIDQELMAVGHATAAEESLDARLSLYLDIWMRIPRQVTWHMNMSRELSTKIVTLRPAIQTGLQQFVAKARAGEDLRPHLHDKITGSRYRPDFLYYDWGVFHFHLGIKLNPSLGAGLDGHGFASRTREVLLAMTHPRVDRMYLIDVLPHKRGSSESLSQQALLAIVEDNWPDLLAPYVLDASGVEHEATNLEIKRTREGGVNAFVRTPGGRVLFSPGGGITTARTSMRRGIEVDDILREVAGLEEDIKRNKGKYEEYFTAKHNISWDDLHVSVVKIRPRLIVKEVASGEILLGQAP